MGQEGRAGSLLAVTIVDATPHSLIGEVGAGEVRAGEVRAGEAGAGHVAASQLEVLGQNA